jgi:hypothetical protein
MGADPTADSFFHTMNTPTMMASSTTTTLTPPEASTPSADANPTTIKMEDLQVPFSTPSPAPSSFSSNSASTPAPSTSDAKPVKKRKSWGQVLPEPKTSLPPRKRAKTEDEKEQRRIERVKRNRLAAHNSRERKRQETEHLQTEKDQLEVELRTLREKTAKMAHMEAELKFWRDKYPNDTPESSFDLTPAFTESTETVCPARTSVSFPSPVSIDSMESPRDSSCQPETPASTFEATPDFDLTQYPAAVLCDLQCQSASGMASPSLAAILAYLTLFNLYTQSMRSLSTWTTSSTLTSSLKAQLQWNPLAWLILSTSSTQPSLAPTPLQTLTAFLTALMQSSLTCRVPLAQLTLATRLSQWSTSVEAVTEPGREVKQAGTADDALKKRLMTGRLEQLGRRKGVQSLNRDFKSSMGLGWEHPAYLSTRRRLGIMNM